MGNGTQNPFQNETVSVIRFIKKFANFFMKRNTESVS